MLSLMSPKQKLKNIDSKFKLGKQGKIAKKWNNDLKLDLEPILQERQELKTTQTPRKERPNFIIKKKQGIQILRTTQKLSQRVLFQNDLSPIEKKSLSPVKLSFGKLYQNRLFSAQP